MTRWWNESYPDTCLLMKVEMIIRIMVMGRMMVIVMMIKDPIYNDDLDEDCDVVTVLLVGDHGSYQRLNFVMNSESEYNVIIEELYSLICDCLIVIVYQGSDVVDSPIYDKYQDVDDPLRFDIYEDCDVIIDQIFDTHSNKVVNDTINFVYQGY